MSRYFFHTADGVECHDPEGTELPDRDTAWREGVKLLGELLAEDPSIVAADHHFEVQVSDEAGLMLFVIGAFSTAAPAARTIDL